MRAVAEQRQARRLDRLDRADRVALDARHLDQPADRIAGQAEIMLHADLGGILDLAGRCRRAPRSAPPRPSSRRPRPRPGNRPRRPEIDAFSLNRLPIAAAVSRKRSAAFDRAHGAKRS